MKIAGAVGAWRALRILGVLLLYLPAACAPTPLPEQLMVSAYASPAAEPWLTDLYTCAARSNTAINISAASPAIALRIGEPETLTTPAFQIGSEEILIVTQRQNPLELTVDEARTLFAQGGGTGQVWVYPADTDLQKAFEQLVMQGRRITSSAGVTVSPQEMSAALLSDPAALGILPRRALTDDLRVVASAGSVPVLALTKEELQGEIAALISCLQDN